MPYILIGGGGNQSHGCIVGSAGKEWNLAAVNHGRQLGASAHLADMAQKREAGYIRAGVDAFQLPDCVGCIFIQSYHGIYHGTVLLAGQQAAFVGSHQNAGAQSLGQNQNITLTDAVVAQNPVGMNQSGDAEAVFGNIVLDGVAAYQDGS